MKKQIIFLTLILLVGFTQVGLGQTTINFDTPGNWVQDGAIALTSYGNHSYVESGVTIAGTNVLRNTTSAQDGFAGALGTYSMRIGNTALSKVIITVSSGGVGNFSIKVRRWDNNPMPNYTVKYSINSGTDWTSLTSIDGTLLTTSDFFTYSGTINSSVSNIVLEIKNTGTTERIMIDDFIWTGYSAGGVADPSLFSASAGSANDIDLSWAQNGNTDDVMVAFNTVDTFGDPSGSYSVNDPITGGGTVIYNSSGVGFNHSSLTANTTYFYKAWSVDGTTTYSSGVTTNATTAKVEPTNHVTSFSATTASYNQINLGWTDAAGGQEPDGYLILANKSGSFTDPVDGVEQADATDANGGIKNISQGTASYSWIGLDASTQYYFKIYPYTNSGSHIDYKIDGVVPQATSTTDVAPVLPNAWINELHYDDDSGDLTEFVEIIIENAATYAMADFSLVLYNGSGGASYSTTAGDAFQVGTTVNVSGKTFKIFYVNFSNTLQNGAPDGVALGYQGSLIQFLSYEGTFTATNGIANGIGSTDIGVSESNITATNSSLGLTGTGVKYSDFTWTTYIGSATKGNQNTTQALPVELSSFTANATAKSVTLNWVTATEVNNNGFEIQRQSSDKAWENVAFVAGNGNSNSTKNYSYTDNNLTAGKYSYRLKQIDNDGKYEYSKVVEVEVNSPLQYALAQNYPNPFNPSTAINFTLPEARFVTLKIYNVLGQEVKTVVNEFKEAGAYKINFDASNLNSGVYFYKLQAGTFSSVKKMTLTK